MYYTINNLITRARQTNQTQTATRDNGRKTVTVTTYGNVTFSPGTVSGDDLAGTWYQAAPKVKKTMQAWCDEAIRTNKPIRIKRDGMTKGVFTLRPFKVRGENKINVEITRDDENHLFYSSMVFSGDFVTV